MNANENTARSCDHNVRTRVRCKTKPDPLKDLKQNDPPQGRSHLPESCGTEESKQIQMEKCKNRLDETIAKGKTLAGIRTLQRDSGPLKPKKWGKSGGPHNGDRFVVGHATLAS